MSGANKPGEGLQGHTTPHPAAFGRDPLPQGERVEEGPTPLPYVCNPLSAWERDELSHLLAVLHGLNLDPFHQRVW